MKDPAKTLDHRLHAAFAWLLGALPDRAAARVRRWTGGRLGIGTQIVVGLGGGVLLTLGAIVMALGLMRVISARQSEVTEQHMPALVGAFDVAQQSAELMRATPRLVAATDLDRPRRGQDRSRLYSKRRCEEAVAALTGAETTDESQGGARRARGDA